MSEFVAGAIFGEIRAGRGGSKLTKLEGDLVEGNRKGDLVVFEEFYPAPGASAGYKRLLAGMEVGTLAGKVGTLVRLMRGITKASEGAPSQFKYTAMILDEDSKSDVNPVWLFSPVRDVKVRPNPYMLLVSLPSHIAHCMHGCRTGDL